MQRLSRDHQKVRKPIRRSLIDLLAVCTVMVTSAATSVHALQDERLNGQLLKLDPATRLEQTCDTEVMLRINREIRKFRVDKVIAYAFGETIIG